MNIIVLVKILITKWTIMKKMWLKKSKDTMLIKPMVIIFISILPKLVLISFFKKIKTFVYVELVNSP